MEKNLSPREQLFKQLKEYRNSLVVNKERHEKGVQKTIGKYPINNNKGYADALVLALLTGLVGGLFLTNIINFLVK